jgi:transcriptional regulator with XRE-family HTH domain
MLFFGGSSKQDSPRGFFMTASSAKSVRQDGASRKRAMPLDAHVGNRVRARRLMLDMSQTELGDALGITFQQVQKYEKGANRIGASRLQNIADVLQVPITFFFEEWSVEATPGQPAAAAAPRAATADAGVREITKALATTDGIELMRAFIRIPARNVRRHLVQLARAIADDQPAQ